jgi:DNA-binding NarL/FixJ family response regulator
MPTMLQEIVSEAFAGEPDIEVVGEVGGDVGDDVELRSSVRSLRPDLVLLRSEQAELSAACRALFDESPRLKVVALTGHGDRGHLWELSPKHLELGEMSVETLLSAIREPRPWRWGS